MNHSDADHLATSEAWLLPTELYSCWNARGLYSPLQFVLRLRPDVHRALESIPSGWHSASDLSVDQLYAASTYLHETIHWWQHVGSSVGLSLSLLYPAQAHLNHRHLINLLRERGPFKSIRAHNLRTAVSRDNEAAVDREINIILNNWHDIEFYRYFITDPSHASSFTDDKYYESQCHSYQVALGALLWLMSSVIDPEVRTLPDPRRWEQESTTLTDERAEGFYFGSPIRIPPLGARQIFEGQARVCQLQYLFRAASPAPSFEEVVNERHLDGVYGEALAWFLELSEITPPATLFAPAIAAFLLICDIAINPAAGLATHFSPLRSLLEQHDPGYRFVRLCRGLQRHKERVFSLIASYTADGYRQASEVICSASGVSSALALANTVSNWSSSMPGLAKLLEEESTFEFVDANLPVRLFVARFARFQADKLAHPEIFCWPGYWGAGKQGTEERAQVIWRLFSEHGALFVDKEDGDVYPRILPDRDQALVQQTFDKFYTWVATYDLVRQWTVGSGDFVYDFGWLTSKFSQDEVVEWANTSFAHVFGVSPRDFRIIPSLEPPSLSPIPDGS